ncbi:WD repeat-containing protein 3-like [Haliotis rufescens]|uniref:WD repeat-containing protein 3-like n=1 Tax=Haliotis rufescens TaxID=6454 RepID=UPI00201EA6E6|nr:WD repeat-containing protein 3-like [Haliotis rufescens]XP_046345382.2 WD repeat-containing protein 3-like [Haliotis rufescens]
MGLTKQYLRYQHSAVFGIVGSQKSNIVFLDIRGTRGKYCAVGACENVLIWDLRTGEKFNDLKGDKHEVTVICRCPDKRHLAVGYDDGTVRVFDLTSGDLLITFSGHKSAVTALRYDRQGLRLVSGARDTDVIVWDIVNESGLFRLRGHKGQITQVCFLKENNVLVTSSKDTFIKFWDLDTQHCFKTLVGHRSEVYDFVLLKNDHRLVTGSSDSELRVWDITYKGQEVADAAESPEKKLKLDTSEDEEEEEESELNILKCTKVGSVMRLGRDRVVSMVTDELESILVCHGNAANVDVFALPSEEKLKKHLAKREKKAKRKLKEEEGEGEVTVEIKLMDEIKRMTAVKMAAKVRALDLLEEQEGESVKCVCLLNNNSIQTSAIHVDNKKAELSDVKTLGLPAHRTTPRTTCFSSDNLAILSASSESIKIWNRDSLQPIRTMPCEYAITSMFAPGDRHVIIGTKSGKLQIFDVASGSLLEDIEAHSGPLWSVSMAPDKRGIMTGSADHNIKFWNFELIKDEEHSSTSKRLTLEHKKTLKMDEDVLCVKYSPDQKFVAASLMDNTVKVFFSDTLKFFLSMYGHKLPVLCMDISSDSTLLVTGSADRNVKIWGMDFGDCHKSIFAHDDSIMCIQFVPRTHLFFSGGKDRKLKQWDADNFELVSTLQGHHGEVFSLTVSSSANFVVSGSQDRSLRLWEKTQEVLVLEDEREMEREQEFEEAISNEMEVVVPGETTTEVALAGKKTVETVKAAERLMEAIEVYREESANIQLHKAECQKTGKELAPPQLNPLILAYGVTSPTRYLLEVIKRIKSSELEEALLVLPFGYVMDLLKVLDIFLQAGWEPELSCRCLLFLLRVHHGQITSSQALLPVIDRLRTCTLTQVTQLRDQIGFNLAGLQFLQGQIERTDEVMFFKDATDRLREKKRKRKKKVILAIKT